MLRPPILVLDEPTSNLDISAIRELREIVAQWKTSGKTVLIAEHRLWTSFTRKGCAVPAALPRR